MSESTGLILKINGSGELITPMITKENGDIVMKGTTWDAAVRYMTTLERINSTYVAFLEKQKISSQ